MKNPKQNKSPLYISCIVSALLLSSCGGGGGGGGDSASESSPTPTPIVQNSSYAVTIDNAGTVPILGSSATNTVIYVHNNTNVAMNNITYSTQNDNSSISIVSNLFAKMLRIFGLSSTNSISINPNSASLCSSIPANGSCPLAFSTPTPTGDAFQGSASITANYVINGKPANFSQLVNYQQITDTSTNGVVVSSGVSLVDEPGTIPYGVVYVYGSGSNLVYNIQSLILNKPGLVITQGDVSGTQFPSGAIQAVEISGPSLSAGSTGISGQLTVNSMTSDGVSNFTTMAQVGIQSAPLSDGALLVAGISPIINTSTIVTGTIPIINSGDQSASGLSISYPTGVVAGPAVSNPCGTTLAINATCNISFSITSSSATGSGTITVGYTNGINASLSQNIQWYNTGSPLVAVYSSINPLVFNGSQSESTIITMTNVGQTTLTNLSIPTPLILSGTATASYVATGDTCTGNSLASNQSCSYTVNIGATTATNGSLEVGFNGSYNNGSTLSYNRILVIPYTANAYAPSLTTTIPSLSIIGNDAQAESAIVSIVNNGSAPATIESNILESAPSYLTTTGTCVGNVLNVGESCNAAIVNLGPVTAESTLTPAGITYNVSYYGGTISSGNPSWSIESISATVQPNQQSITLMSVVASQSSGGDGITSGTPFSFQGYNTSPKNITLTYQNTGTNPIKITGVINANSGYNYTINTASSTCYNASVLPSLAIAANATCSIEFDNVLFQNYLGLGAGLGASYAMNLTVPILVFYDTVANTQFQVQPQLPTQYTGITIVYATAQQATLTTTLVESGLAASNGTVTVTNILANATNYSAVTATTNMEDYFTGAPVMTNCTQNNTTESGIRIQTCTLSSSVLNGSGVYTLGSSAYAGQNLDAMYSVSTGNQIVSISQLYGSLLLK